MREKTEAPAVFSDPLVPADVNLRDFQFMPLDVERLRRSKAWLMAKRDPALGFFLLNLWSASWHEVPAASLEDDDDVLADLAMCNPEKWEQYREKALHGWIKCSDGRFYHPVVAEKAMEAWEKKLSVRAKSKRGNEKRWGNKNISDNQSPSWNGIGESHSDPTAIPQRSHSDPTGIPQKSKETSLGIPQGSLGESLDPKKTHLGIARDRERDSRQGLNSKSTPSVKTADAVSTGDGGDSTQQANGIASTPAPETPPASDSAPVQALLPTVDPPPDDPIPPCPHQQILELYAMILPMLRKPRIWDSKREALLRARWRYCAHGNGVFEGYRTVQDGLAFWERFFRYVAKSPKLTQGIPRDDGSVWLPDLPWLLKAENFTKVIEKKYHGN